MSAVITVQFPTSDLPATLVLLSLSALNDGSPVAFTPPGFSGPDGSGNYTFTFTPLGPLADLYEYSFLATWANAETYEGVGVKFSTASTPSVVAPSGPVSNAVAGLRVLIANTPFFISWTGSANAGAALARVFTGSNGYPIASATISGGVLTIATREPHNLSSGDIVTVNGPSIGAQSGLPIFGELTVVIATQTTFTAATDLPDLLTVYPNFALVWPGVRPLAVVCESTSGGLGSERIGTGGAAVFSGELDVLLEADTPGQYANDPTNADFNAVGSFIQGLMATNDTGVAVFADGNGNSLEFVANDARLAEGPEYTAKSEQDDNTARFERWRAMVKISWGLKG